MDDFWHLHRPHDRPTTATRGPLGETSPVQRSRARLNGSTLRTMPLPMWVTRVNLRVANPVIGMLSDDLPPLATLHHVGRTSGRRFRTPIMAFPSPDHRRITIALTYGPQVQWLRNIEAGRPARLVRRRRVLALSDPVRLHGAEGARSVPRWTRLALRALGTDEFVSLQADDPYHRR